MAVLTGQFESEVGMTGIYDVDSFALFWYDVCSEFIVWAE